MDFWVCGVGGSGKMFFGLGWGFVQFLLGDVFGIRKLSWVGVDWIGWARVVALL